MANRDMKVSVLVQLVDRLTAPLRGMTRGIAGVANRVADLGRRIGVVGAALSALSFAAPIQAAAAWDSQLRATAITAGKTGAAVEKMISDTSLRWKQVAQETGQYAMDVAKGASLLQSAGMDNNLIEKMMPTIAKVATATGATIEDTAKTVFALNDTLKVGPEQMEAMLGKLVTAGKLGRFEFKNMATEFPGLTAQMAKFGITGAEAVESLGAALQIAMLGTANPSEAANNLKNFLTKINAPEAIKKFEKELKVDVTGVMTDAAAKGINPIEAVVQKLTEKLKVPTAEIDKIMKKAGQSNMPDKDKEKAIRGQISQLLEGTKVGKIYADMQVLDFLIPALLNIDKMKEFKRQIKEAGIDVISEDFASAMRGLAPQMKQLSDLGTTALERVGMAFAKNIPAIKNGLQELLTWVAATDKQWPGLIDNVLTWTGAALLVGAAIAILTPIIGALAAVLGILFSPIALIVLAFAALAFAAWYVYQNWDTIGHKLKAIWDGMVAPVVNAWNTIKQAFTDAVAWVETKGGELITWGQNLPSRVTGALSDLGTRLKQAGLDAIQGLWDGMTTKFGELIGWVQGIPGRIVSALGNIDLSNMIKWPTLPKWLGGGSSGAPGGPPVDPMGNPTGGPASLPSTGLGGQSGFTRTAGGPAANSNVQVGGRIVVEAAEGTRIVNVQSENPAVPVTPNRGTMLGRA